MKVIVGLSGGVDSSVAAALLQKQGHEVIGAFMKNWTDTKDVEGVCDWKNDKRDAQRVAAKLGIPLIILDYQKEYREQVVDYMFAEYSAGRTPNPDVMCNNTVKFGPFLKAAEKLGAEKIATGHYAGVKEVGGVFYLIQAKDKDKDQTYFLHRLNQMQLSKALFPLAGYTKTEIRQLAKDFDLPTADRKESMGVCFIGDINVKEFLKQKIRPKPGDVVTTSGKKVGEHEGLAYYTIGQRHGVGSSGALKPLYVVQKNKETNTLVVGVEDDPKLYKSEVPLENIHWISDEVQGEVLVRFRHRQDLQEATLAESTLYAKKPQRAIAPGQFAAFYKEGRCVGGGIIK